MSNELAAWCNKFDFSENLRDFTKEVETLYKQIAQAESNENGMTMCEWIFENTNIEDLKCLTDKERFLLGLGILTSEIMNY